MKFRDERDFRYHLFCVLFNRHRKLRPTGVLIGFAQLNSWQQSSGCHLRNYYFLGAYYAPSNVWDTEMKTQVLLLRNVYSLVVPETQLRTLSVT